MKVLVIDATHGGLTLSEAFAGRGDNVTCVDVYKTMRPEDYERYSKLFLIEEDIPGSEMKYDLVVSPVHFPPSLLNGIGGNLITHHEAVRMLVSDSIRFPVVEITGSFGKTTAARCAISLLRDDYSILGLTSDGVIFTEGGNEEVLLKGVSSTPANIIRALRLSPKEPDLAIFEVSLGGTGMATLGIIKNVYDNYPIAKGTSSALTAKLSMVRSRRPGSTVLLNMDDPLLRGIPGSQYFSAGSLPCEVSTESVQIGLGYLRFISRFSGFMTMDGPLFSRVLVEAYNGPVGRQHLESMLLGVSIAKYFGVSEDRIEIPSDVFSEKMVVVDPSGPLVLNRSPAINGKVVAASIKDFLEILPPARLEIGGKVKTTCGSVDPKEVAKVVNSSPFEDVYLFGELGELLNPLITKRKCGEYRSPSVPTLRIERG